MIQLSFKNRIALNYIITTGLLIVVVFSVIYSIVKHTVYNHIDEKIKVEIQNHQEEIKEVDGKVILIDEEEWNEREHNTVDVNPVFVEFLDVNKNITEKAPNLKTQTLKFNDSVEDFELFDTKMGDHDIRQIQVPLHIRNKKIGYVIVAMSLSDSKMVLNNLFDIMSLSFLGILLLLFFIARFFAGRSIKPINSIINTSKIITKDNLKTRIPLPKTRDELYTLSKTINNLLNRIEDAIEREKQFTSDASHELRTPLTVIKGTLEVLIRKPRDNKEYEEKINYCIKEVDHLNMLVDQLLLMARFENQSKNINTESVYLNSLILDVLTLNSEKISSQKIKIKFDAPQDYYIQSDNFLVITILRNIISNAVKYTNKDGEVTILLSKQNEKIVCKISDNGIGIEMHDLEAVFNPFFRSNSTDHPEIKGTGLGLSIVKRITELLHIKFKIDSQIGVGTTVILSFDDNMKTLS
ncbi:MULTISPECIES: HAMP domain-containing sensor histidine kinase [unclassified Flavobacterium]|uniref:sensor histidine kinase n=1 Tax=unclassified Flavobacterium TaxID=196869 RepID=UPI0012A93967|nr:MULTISPECIES: HAMP domain-containing sensor histidine kinase [unclassified Flavobacterium]MBF4483273.1 HAMP domain-containing histidine kinase [Flavobacterium sp. CSZ]QGK74067.1 HAMP domain-containing protein [Flavobacterium sp. SLB02]